MSTQPSHGEPASADVAALELEPANFPIHALNSVMREMVENVAEVHRVPVELPAMCAVGIVSGALGNAFKLTDAVDGKVCHGNLYIVAAAPKSSGKGSVASTLICPLMEASQEIGERYSTATLPRLMMDRDILERKIKRLADDLARGKSGRSSNAKSMGKIEIGAARSELLAARTKLEAILPQIDALPTYWVGNATSEAMAAQFKRNNLGLLCYSPEAGETVRVLLGKYRGDGKADFDLALSGYSVEAWRSDRIGRGVCQIHPCLSMLLLVQPSILRELIGNEEAFERGMTARVLTFIVETEPLEDDGITRRIPEQVEAAWSEMIKRILSRRDTLALNPHFISCTPEAREVFRAFHNESIGLRRGEYRDIEAELGRWRENAIRLAIGQCVADDLEAAELTREQAERAVEIMRWSAASSLKITNAALVQKRVERADQLEDILSRKSSSETIRNLEKSHGFTAEELASLAGKFPERFHISTEETGGRPSKIVRLVK